MKVLIFLEDSTPNGRDQYIVKPIIEEIFRQICDTIKQPPPELSIAGNPLEGVDYPTGYHWMLKGNNLHKLIHEIYGNLSDIYIAVVDNDREEQRISGISELESTINTNLLPRKQLFFSLAYQSVEAWIAAGHDLLEGWTWEKVKNKRAIKRNYFKHLTEDYIQQLIEKNNLDDYPDNGIELLAREAIKNCELIFDRCSNPKELKDLMESIKVYMLNNTGETTT